MAIRYVNPASGTDDLEARGTSDKPFKTINYALSSNIVQDGDEINVLEVASILVDRHTEHETVKLINRNDITIRFGDEAGGYSQLLWIMDPPSGPVSEIGNPDTSYAIYLSGCRGIKIIGCNFGCIEGNGQTGCIFAEDCSGLEIYNCHINSSYYINSDSLSFIKLNRSKAEINNLSLNKLRIIRESSPTAYGIRMVDVSGDSSLTIYSSQWQDYFSQTLLFTGVYTDPDVRNISINGLLVHDCESCTIEGSAGIVINCDPSSITDFDIRNCQFSSIRYGVIVKDMPYPKGSETRRICQSTFYKCCEAIFVANSYINVICVSIYGSEDEGSEGETITVTTIDEEGNEIETTEEKPPAANQYFYQYPVNVDRELDTYGINAVEDSFVNVLNTIVTYCNVCFRAVNSFINVARTIFCDCSFYKSEVGNSTVTATDYVRCIDPRYIEIDRYPFGYFELKASSPCINAGKAYGLTYMDIAPNIGAIDSSKATTIQDIPTILSRQLRNSETLKMTNIDVEKLLTDGIRDLDPDANADREGSALKDLVVKPISQLSQVFLSEVEEIKRNQSFLNISEMGEDNADALGANLLVTRRKGNKATGVVRMFFGKPIDVDLPAEMMFSSSSGLNFYSTTATVVSSEEMRVNTDGNLYYADVTVEAEKEGTEYNVSPGEVTVFSDIIDENLVLVTNIGYFSGGEKKETNEEYYERIKLALTTRCLNTTKGVKYQFLDQFSFIRRVTVIGKGDQEMIRDDLGTLLNGTEEIIPINYGVTRLSDIHVGGMTDVYVQVYEPIEDSVTVQMVPALAKLGSLGLTDKPVLRITSIEICDPNTLDTTGVIIPEGKWELVCNDPRTRFSTREDMSLKMDEDYVGDAIKINYVWASEISALQTWAEAEDNRVVCEDILVKHYQPAFTSLSVAYYANEEVQGLQGLIEEFIKGIPEKKSLKVSELVHYIHQNSAVHVITPLLITSVLHKVDGSIERLESFDEVIIDRTACFLPDNIEVVYLGEDEYS